MEISHVLSLSRVSRTQFPACVRVKDTTYHRALTPELPSAIVAFGTPAGKSFLRPRAESTIQVLAALWEFPNVVA